MHKRSMCVIDLEDVLNLVRLYCVVKNR